MKAKILLVEDNPINMRLLKMMLRPGGYVLLEAADGQTALDVALYEEPELIVMDIQLPKISGIEVTRRLRENPALRNTRIIALTAFAMKGDRDKIHGAGFDACLTKPVDTRTFPQFIARMLQQRQQSVSRGGDHDKKIEGPGS